MKFIKRDPYGNKIEPKQEDMNNDKDARTDKPMNPRVPVCIDSIIAKFDDNEPSVAINDNRVETFLCTIAEESLHGMSAMMDAYKQAGFNVDKPVPVIKNDIRRLLSHKRVRDRLKYMKECEWDINKPDISLICKKLNDIIDDDELAVNAKITAINSLAKLAGMFEQNQHKSDTKVAIVFNTQEKPPDVEITQVQ